MITLEFETKLFGIVTVTEAPEEGIHPNGHAHWRLETILDHIPGQAEMRLKHGTVACSYTDLEQAVEDHCGPLGRESEPQGGCRR